MLGAVALAAAVRGRPLTTHCQGPGLCSERRVIIAIALQGAPCGAAGASDGGWEWPPLSAVEVLGWWPRVATARVEVTRPSDACGGEAEVVQSVEVDNSQVGAGALCQLLFSGSLAVLW